MPFSNSDIYLAKERGRELLRAEGHSESKFFAAILRRLKKGRRSTLRHRRIANRDLPPALRTRSFRDAPERSRGCP
jgi:hypothetical protein